MDISTLSLSGLPVFDRASQQANQTEQDRSQQAAQNDASRAQEAGSTVSPTQRLPDLEGAESSQQESAEGESRGRNLDVYA